MKKTILFFIRTYQWIFSLDQGIVGRIFSHEPICRFAPTCSEYLYQAVSRYGIIDGLRLGVRRILRCHPWGGSGIDSI